MSGNKLILNDQPRHEVAVPDVERVAAVGIANAIDEHNVDKVGNASSMAEPAMTAVQAVHVNIVGEDGEADVSIAQRRKKLRVVRKAEKRRTINQFFVGFRAVVKQLRLSLLHN